MSRCTRAWFAAITLCLPLACSPADDESGSNVGGGSSEGGSAQGGSGQGGMVVGGSGQGGNGAGGSGGGNGCAPTTQWEAGWETLENDFIALVNARRQAGGMCGNQTMAPMHEVTLDTTLRGVTRAHAEDMGVDDYFAYDSPDNISWLMQPQACGYGSPPSAQNIASGHDTAQSLFDSLVSSEGTCVNLHGAGNHIGVGHYASTSAQFAAYWVMYIGQGS